MDLCNKNTIKEILKNNHLWAKKRLGQNFLVARHPLDQIMKSANIRDNEVIVEIGPGLGTLTQELAKKAKLVLAIEKDRGFVEWLRKYFKGKKNVKIICQDILTYDLRLIYPEQNRGVTYDYKVVSNLPYNITSAIINKFLTAENPTTPHKGLRGAGPPQEMLLMTQKEMAERLCAKPGNSERGFMSVLVEFYSNAKIIDYVSKENFWPQPEVDSAIIKIRLNQSASKTSFDPRQFLQLVKIGFSQKRRQIHHPLRDGLHLSKDKVFEILKKVGINPTMRAEDLSLDKWLDLYKNVSLL